MGGQFLPPCRFRDRTRRALPVPGLCVRIDIRPAGLRIQALEHVLIHVRLAFDELDAPVAAHHAAIEEPQIAVARDIDQTLDGAPVALEIDQDRRRNFVPIPGIVRMVLEVSLDLAGGDIERDGRRGVEIVAGPLVAHPRTAVADAPVREVRVRIVISRDPDGAAAGLPLVALGPGFAAGFAGRGNRVGAPLLLAGFRIECGDESADSEFAARRARPSPCRPRPAERARCSSPICCRRRRWSRLPAGLRVQRHQHRFARGEVDAVAEQRDAAAGIVRNVRSRGTRPAVAPQNVPALGVDGDHLIVRRRDEHHAVVDDRRGFMDPRLAGREAPRRASVARRSPA